MYGKVKEAVVLVDKKGNSKGYGFVTFDNATAALEATKVIHIIIFRNLSKYQLIILILVNFELGSIPNRGIYQYICCQNVSVQRTRAKRESSVAS